MNKVFGKKTDFAPIREDASRVIISYGYEVVDEENATWLEIYLYKKQISQVSLADVKNAIIADIDAKTDEKILCGFQWTVLHGDDQGKVVNVWLSVENQINYKGFHDAAHDYPEQVEFPAVFKLGQDENGEAVYESFETLAEVATFYLGAIGYIKRTVAEGWQVKNAFDWSPYEALFPHSEQPQTANEE